MRTRATEGILPQSVAALLELLNDDARVTAAGGTGTSPYDRRQCKEERVGGKKEKSTIIL